MTKVSVIIPTYQSEAYISQAIESVLKQSYKDFEIIIVDDGSKDNTDKILKTYSSNNFIKMIFQKNQGPSTARNRGINESSGEYIAFLDSDDIWLPDKLEKQIKVMENDPLIGLVYSDTYFFDSEKIWPKTSFRFQIPGKGSVFNTLFVENFIPLLTVIIRRTCMDANNLFNSEFEPAEDYDLWLRVSQKMKIAYVNEPLAKYRVHPKQASSKAEKMLSNLIRMKENIIEDGTVREKLSDEALEKGYYKLLIRYGKILVSHGRKEEARVVLSKYFALRGFTLTLFLIKLLVLLPTSVSTLIIKLWDRSNPFYPFIEQREMGK